MKQEDYYGGFNKKNNWVEYQSREEALKNGIKADEMSVIPYKESKVYNDLVDKKQGYLKAYYEMDNAATNETFNIIASAQDNAGDTYGSSLEDIDVHKAQDWYYTFIGSIVSILSDDKHSQETIDFFKSFGIEA